MQDLKALEDFYQEQLLLLSNFLGKYHAVWSQEIIGNFPETLDSYSPQWFESLSSLNQQQEWDLDCDRGHHMLEDGQLKDLFTEIYQLKQVPRMKEDLAQSLEQQKYPSWALFQVGGKKQHEIKAICHHLQKANTKDKIVLDIGGGKGHLCRILAHYHGYNAKSIDTDANLQELGRKRLAKYPPPPGHGELEFIHHTFGSDPKFERELFENTPLSIGLHTCGPLALGHLDKASAGQCLLNIGCCYHRLRNGETTHLSRFSQKEAYCELTKFALTLATRGHTDISLKDYEVKKRVKYCRSALQLFTNLKKGKSNFESVGSNHPRDYFQSFSHYALPKMKGLEIEATEDELNDFYQSSQTTKNLDLIFKGNLVRWRFGRLIEKYLIYDRALWLVERGHAAQVFQIFDEKISPRNMAISINSLT